MSWESAGTSLTWWAGSLRGHHWPDEQGVCRDITDLMSRPRVSAPVFLLHSFPPLCFAMSHSGCLEQRHVSLVVRVVLGTKHSHLLSQGLVKYSMRPETGVWRLINLHVLFTSSCCVALQTSGLVASVRLMTCSVVTCTGVVCCVCSQRALGMHFQDQLMTTCWELYALFTNVLKKVNIHHTMVIAIFKLVEIHHPSHSIWQFYYQNITQLLIHILISLFILNSGGKKRNILL